MQMCVRVLSNNIGIRCFFSVLFFSLLIQSAKTYAQDDFVSLEEAYSSFVLPKIDASVGEPFDIRSDNDIQWFPWEGWDPLSGTLSIHMKDLVFPGNTGIPLTLSRTHRGSIMTRGHVGLGLDVPTLNHNSTQIGGTSSCNEYTPIENINSNSGSNETNRSSGVYFVYGPTQIHFFDYQQSINSSRFPTDALLISPDNWYITCDSGTFNVHANNGTRYEMSVKSTNTALLVSQTTDKFGNTVTYEYHNNSAGQKRFTRIYSNDDRELSFDYRDGRAYVVSNGAPNPHSLEYFFTESSVYQTLHVKNEDSSTTSLKYNRFTGKRIEKIRVPTLGLTHYTYEDNSAILKSRTVQNTLHNYDHSETQYFSAQDSGTELSRTITTPLVKNRYTLRKSVIDKDNIGDLSGFVHEAQGKIVKFEQFLNDGVPLEQSTPYMEIDYVYQKDNSVSDVVGLVNTYSGSEYPTSWISLFHGWKSRIKTTTSHRKLGNEQIETATRTVEERDDFGRPKKVRETGTAGSRTITFGYDEIDLWNTVLLADVKVYKTEDLNNGEAETESMEFEYDAYGRVTNQYENGIRTQYIYDDESDPSELPNGLVAQIIDGKGRTFTYDNYVRGIAEIEGRVGKDNLWEYKNREVNTDGTVKSESRWSDENALWEYEYDSSRRISIITSPRADTAPVHITWTDRNHVQSEQDRLKTETRYDGFGRIVFEGSQDTEQSIHSNTFRRYDRYGRLEFQSIPASTTWDAYLDDSTLVKGTTYRYDNFGRLTKSQNSGGIGNLDYQHDVGGKPSLRTTDKNDIGDPRSTTQYYEYYGDFRSPIINKIVDGNGISTTFTHDVAGKIRETVRDGITRSYDYHANALLKSETHPETGSTYYWYDPSGLLAWIANDSPYNTATERARRAYDNSARLTKIRYGNGAGEHYVDQSFIYDKYGNLERVTSDGILGDDWIATEYTYDEEDNLITEKLRVDGQEYLLSYQYDDLSGLSTRTFPTGNTYGYAPDAFGRPTQIIGEGGGSKEILSNIEYYPDGQPSEVENSGGTYSRTRLSFGLPRTVRTKPKGSGYHGQRYSYDNSGNVTSRAYVGVSNMEDIFAYDGNNRLSTAEGPSIGNWVFNYDNRDNIKNYTENGVKTWFHYDGNNRLTAMGSKSVSYDSRHNITNFDGFWTGFNKADQIYGDSNGHTYRYDGFGLRVYEKYGDGDFVDYTMYDREGILRYRHGKQYNIHSEYHTVNGQLFARRDIGPNSSGGGSGGSGGSSGGSGTPTCQDSTSDPDGDGWGWENGASCRVETSSGGGTPICQDSTSDSDGDGWGWENGASCIVP